MKNKLIYIRIPRCAGTTMRYYLNMKLELLGRVGKEQWTTNRPMIDFYCDGYDKELEKIKKLGEIWTSSEKFAIIRNPFTKIVSAYEYCKRLNPDFYISFKCLCKNIADIKLPDFEYKHIKRLQTNHFIQECKYLIPIENFSVKLNELLKSKKIIQHDLKCRHVNQTTDKKPLWEYYDQKVIDSVVDFFKKDFEYLGYSTTLPSY